MLHHYDVLVVGAGPAGASAALEAAKNDAKVLLIERKKMIGEPVQCAEYVPKLLLSRVPVSSACIAQKVAGMITYLPSGNRVKTQTPGYILNRNIFDKELVMEAVDNGVNLRKNTVCMSKKKDKIGLIENGRKESITTKIVIGADGPRSTVGQWINSENTEFMIGVQYTVPLVSPLDFTEIYFDKDFFGGYGWVFPKGKNANVGIGVKHQEGSVKHTPKVDQLVKKFVAALEKKNKLRNILRNRTGGLIPCGGTLTTVKDNVILVGDAAGQTHAITGGGIPQAVLCGKIAGKTAVKAILEEDLSILREYVREWQVIFGDELQRARKKRELLEKQWDHLDQVIKKCWVAFHEYYDDYEK